MNRYTGKTHSRDATSNDHRPAKRTRYDRGGDCEDDFPDGDFTVEEFDFCLTQATGVSSKPTTSRTDTGSVSNGVVDGAFNLSYNHDGQLQLLQRKVAALSKELHETRLSKQDELKAQADAFLKERHDLKSQIEFKEGELRSAAIRQATLEEKLRGKGIETRFKQLVDGATSTNDSPYNPAATRTAGPAAPKVVLKRGSKKALLLSSQYGMHPPLGDRTGRAVLAHLDVLRDYTSKRKTRSASPEGTSAALLSLRALTEAVAETVMSVPATASIPADRVFRSADKFNERFIFDILADLSSVGNSRVHLEIASLLHSFASSSEQACGAILREPSMLSRLLSQVQEEEVAIVVYRLFSLLAAADNSFAAFCCTSSTVTCCMWKSLCQPLKQDVGEALLSEGLQLTQHTFTAVQSLCPCFGWFVTKVLEKLRALLLSLDKGECSVDLLSRICALAQTETEYRPQVCRMLTQSKHLSRLAQVWPFLEDDNNQSPGSEPD